MKRYRLAALGAAGGLIGALAGALVLWGAWMLPVLGLLFTRANPVLGGLAVGLLGALGGAIYGLVYPLWAPKRPGPAALAAGGLVLGLVTWVAGPLALVPAVLGFPPFPAAPLDQLASLGAFLAYGVVTSFVLGAWVARRGRLVGVPAAILALSATAALFLLRSASSTDPAALVLPRGYRAEVVATGLTYPTSLAIAPDGTVFVGEAGFAYGPKEAIARVVTIGAGGALREIARGFEGPLNGLALRDDELYVSHRGKVSVLTLSREQGQITVAGRRDLVSGLPSLGDHHNNDLVFGPDGSLFLGQGTATNTGVVGSDNFVYAWADRHPGFHDVPSRGWTLTGRNYPDLDLRTARPADRTETGPFAPFGTTRDEGTTVEPGDKPSGAILRIDPETGQTTVYADGLRNPYGLALAPDGSLYATNLGYDDRGVRAVRQSPDWLVRVHRGAWYGWPDFAGQLSLTDARFASRRGVDLRPLIANPPAVEPPLAEFPPHASPMKLAVSPGGAFGDQGGIYVALFGDAQPLTEDLGSALATRVVRVDPLTGEYRTFLENRGGRARAGRYGGGLKRAVGVAFAPGGEALYVLDFGHLEMTDLAPNAIPRTGVLWRVVPE
ncbi:MAG: PQQ-dependent sugar dehydrogenase [bacterium]|nr:PQQ-dependent sugar dehydrogenase [bacterium]